MFRFEGEYSDSRIMWEESIADRRNLQRPLEIARNDWPRFLIPQDLLNANSCLNITSTKKRYNPYIPTVLGTLDWVKRGRKVDHRTLIHLILRRKSPSAEMLERTAFFRLEIFTDPQFT